MTMDDKMGPLPVYTGTCAGPASLPQAEKIGVKITPLIGILIAIVMIC